jgi:hypothetical protein
MKSLVGALVALAVGAVLAVAAVFGVKASIDPDGTPSSSTSNIAGYDAPDNT